MTKTTPATLMTPAQAVDYVREYLEIASEPFSWTPILSTLQNCLCVPTREALKFANAIRDEWVVTQKAERIAREVTVDRPKKKPGHSGKSIVIR